MNARIAECYENGDVETAKRLKIQRREMSSVDTHDDSYRRLRYVRYADDFTSTNSVATLFAWTGALRKRGEPDGPDDLKAFADKLEKATIQTIEDGIMTGDLYLLSKLENKKKVGTEKFLRAVNERLEAMM